MIHTSELRELRTPQVALDDLCIETLDFSIVKHYIRFSCATYYVEKCAAHYIVTL